MGNLSLTDRLAQAEDSEIGEAFNSFMHTAARAALTAVLFEEVEACAERPIILRKRATANERNPRRGCIFSTAMKSLSHVPCKKP